VEETRERGFERDPEERERCCPIDPLHGLGVLYRLLAYEIFISNIVNNILCIESTSV
jgi:hypothetical protein